MPSGNVHSVVTVGLAAGLAYLGHQQAWPYVPLAAGALAGLILTPDLDLDNGSISDKFVRKSGGCLLGMAWSVLWWPYRKLISHRSILSHGPLIGTAIRIVYVIGIPLLVLQLLALSVDLPGLPGWWPWPVAGLVAADCMHFIMDKLFKN